MKPPNPWITVLYSYALLLIVLLSPCSANTDGSNALIASSTYYVGNLGRGIAANDQAVGTGFIMYSEESVYTRFASAPPFNAQAAHHLIVVRYNSATNTWSYDRNGAHAAFKDKTALPTVSLLVTLLRTLPSRQTGGIMVTI